MGMLGPFTRAPVLGGVIIETLRLSSDFPITDHRKDIPESERVSLTLRGLRKSIKEPLAVPDCPFCTCHLVGVVRHQNHQNSSLTKI